MNMKKETSKIIAEISSNLAHVIASSAFEFWKRNDVRLYVKFSTLSQTEQDRIFNELEVSVLGLCELHLEYASRLNRSEKNIVFSALHKDLPFAFLQLLCDLGVENTYINIWKRLIDMRLKEYGEHFKLAYKESKKEREFQAHEEELRITWARIETITIDCLTHIRRGDVLADDPLWKLLRKWLIMLDVQIASIESQL